MQKVLILRISTLADVAVRYLLLFLGLAVMSLGIAFAIRSDLGTTPISSVPYVLSIITPLTMGTLMIAMNLVFLLGQILLLRRRFPLIQLLQIPVLFIFGLFNDLALWLVRGVDHSAYWQQWALVVIGIVFVGIGVTLQVRARATPLAGEALILTISNELIRKFGARKPLRFSSVKIQFDTTLVLSAVVLSLVFAHEVVGVREGTVAAALLVGVVVQVTMRLLPSARPEEQTATRTVETTPPR